MWSAPRAEARFETMPNPPRSLDLARRQVFCAVVGAARGCYEAGRADPADTNTSWLHACVRDDDCSDLGVGFVCSAGRCDEPGVESVSTAEPETEADPNAASESDTPPGTDAARSDVVEAGRLATRIDAMVEVATLGGSTLVDPTEVTQAQYEEFLSCVTGPCNAQHVPCVVGNYRPTETPDWPVLCPTGEGAAAYCTWVGKRMCELEELMPACDSTWERISNHNFAPQVADARSCIMSAFVDGDWGAPSEPAPVGSAPDCRGVETPYDRIFDVIGNAAEMLAGCDQDSCREIGGSHTFGPHGSSCDVRVITPPERPVYTGFRCCVDAETGPPP